MNIREAITAGAESIANLASEFHNYLKDLGDQTSFYFNATTYLRDGFGANPAFFGFVAEIEGAVVGYLLYHFGYDTDLSRRLTFIIDLYVGEKYRARRIGTALMKPPPRQLEIRRRLIFSGASISETNQRCDSTRVWARDT